LAKNKNYFGEGNSKERTIEYEFEYCLDCNLRLLNKKPIITQDILNEEFERYIIESKKGNQINLEKITIQHTDFENLQRLIQKAYAFGKLREKIMQRA
jgi:hypothetical protein